MIVYRFEKNGIGPYVGGCKMTVGSFFGRDKAKTRTEKKYQALFGQLLCTKESEGRYEVWQKTHESNTYMYGCISKDQLRAYFGGNFKQLFRQGYRIKRYRVPDDEVIGMGVEVAFPVKYHKLQTVKKVKEAAGYLYSV